MVVCTGKLRAGAVEAGGLIVSGLRAEPQAPEKNTS